MSSILIWGEIPVYPPSACPHLALDGLEPVDELAEPVELFGEHGVHQGLAALLHLGAGAPQPVHELDAEYVVRRADVLPAPVAGVAGNDGLDLLQKYPVLFNPLPKVGHAFPSAVVMQMSIFKIIPVAAGGHSRERRTNI